MSNTQTPPPLPIDFSEWSDAQLLIGANHAHRSMYGPASLEEIERRGLKA